MHIICSYFRHAVNIKCCILVELDVEQYWIGPRVRNSNGLLGTGVSVGYAIAKYNLQLRLGNSTRVYANGGSIDKTVKLASIGLEVAGV